MTSAASAHRATCRGVSECMPGSLRRPPVTTQGARGDRAAMSVTQGQRVVRTCQVFVHRLYTLCLWMRRSTPADTTCGSGSSPTGQGCRPRRSAPGSAATGCSSPNAHRTATGYTARRMRSGCTRCWHCWPPAWRRGKRRASCAQGREWGSARPGMTPSPATPDTPWARPWSGSTRPLLTPSSTAC